MRFDLDDEQRAIKDAARELCRAQYELSTANLEAQAQAGELWQQLATSGWTQLCVPQRAGGGEPHQHRRARRCHPAAHSS